MSVEPSVDIATQPAAPPASLAGRTPVPGSTMTFLFSDIEGSTRLVQELGAAYQAVLADHDGLMEAAIVGRGGRVFGHEGDAVFAAFADAASAVQAALDAQRALTTHAWPHGRPVRVRIGIHAGEAVPSGAGYVGLPLHQVARITSAANGGQVVVSEAARALALPGLGQDVELRDLGEHQLKDLARPERLYELVAEGLPASILALRTTPARPNNLPLQLTSFVGRAEIEEARRLLATTRLLTLTGPGGTGKTRLALQLAREVMNDFPDGTYFVELDAVDDAELVPSEIAHTLHLELGADPPIERLVRDLREKRALIVLDNFEQVVGAAPMLSRLLREAPGLQMIVTSRIVLRAYGEQEFQVPPLSGDEAVRLFVERATAANSTFRLNGNAEAVTDIVTRLDGLPLAIELAAARVRVLPVEALRSRLDQRLAVLTGGPRDLPARQQTLRGAIDWSYDLLEEPDRRLFERFSVFAGGASLTEIEAICGPAEDLGEDVLDGLASLAEKSLLRSVESGHTDPRFAMLATIREYATERLAARGHDQARTRERHARTYLAIAETCAPNLTGAAAASFLDRLELDHDNLRAAMDWTISAGELELAARMGVGLWRFWQVRGHLSEARDRLAAVVDAPGAGALPPGVRARLLGAAGSVAYWSGDADSVGQLYRAALEAARAADDPVILAEATYNAGFEPILGQGRRQRYAFGGPLFQEALRLYREIGDERGEANATWALAISELAAGDVPAARRHFEESLALNRRLGQHFGAGWALHMMGLIDLNERQPDAADRRFREAAALFRQSNDLSAIVLLLQDFALVAELRGQSERYWTLGGASRGLSLRTGTGLASNTQDFIDVEPPTRPVDDPEAERAWDAGFAMAADDALTLALEEGPDPEP